MEIQLQDMSSPPLLSVNSTRCKTQWASALNCCRCMRLSILNPAEMTDDHGCYRSRTDMSFLVKADIAALCKSYDLVNKCSEAVKIDCPYHTNSFICSASDVFNRLSTKRVITLFWAASVHFHINDDPPPNLKIVHLVCHQLQFI